MKVYLTGGSYESSTEVSKLTEHAASYPMPLTNTHQLSGSMTKEKTKTSKRLPKVHTASPERGSNFVPLVSPPPPVRFLVFMASDARRLTSQVYCCNCALRRCNLLQNGISIYICLLYGNCLSSQQGDAPADYHDVAVFSGGDCCWVSS